MDIDTLRAKWDGFAEAFERNYERSTLQLMRTLCANARLEGASAVLEVGCGAGGGALEALRHVPDGARYVGVDLSPEMLTRARRRLPDRVELVAADAARLPFEDDAFDVVLANLSLMIVPDTAGVLREIRRVLRPGGTLAAAVWGRPERSPMMTLVPQVVKAIGLELEAPPRSNFHLAPQLRERLLAVGFSRVLQGVQDMPIDVRTGAEFVDLVLLQHPGWRDWLAGLSDEDTTRLARSVDARVEELLDAGVLPALEGQLSFAW